MIEFKPDAGGTVYQVILDAIAFAKTHQKRDGKPVEVFFKVNGLKINCFSTSEPRDVAEKYDLTMQLFRLESTR